MTAATVDVDWRLQAACRRHPNPDLWFDHTTRAVALHICRTHCPVIAQCLTQAKANPPSDGVAGGIAWSAWWKGHDRPQRLRNGCTPARWCGMCAPDRDPAYRAQLRQLRAAVGEGSGA